MFFVSYCFFVANCFPYSYVNCNICRWELASSHTDPQRHTHFAAFEAGGKARVSGSQRCCLKAESIWLGVRAEVVNNKSSKYTIFRGARCLDPRYLRILWATVNRYRLCYCRGPRIHRAAARGTEVWQGIPRASLGTNNTALVRIMAPGQQR